jgi:hypothetical protein
MLKRCVAGFALMLSALFFASGYGIEITRHADAAPMWPALFALAFGTLAVLIAAKHD